VELIRTTPAAPGGEKRPDSLCSVRPLFHSTMQNKALHRQKSPRKLLDFFREAAPTRIYYTGD
jgi:hypothetical protein